MRSVSDVLALDGFDGCAADREYLWHLGADPSEYHRYPNMASYKWTPPDTCDIRPLERESLVKELVEGGGWLLIGGEHASRYVYSSRLEMSRPFPIVRGARSLPLHAASPERETLASQRCVPDF